MPETTSQLFVHTARSFFPVPRFLQMPAAGVAISEDAVRVIALSDRGSEQPIHTYGTHPLPAGAVEGGTVADGGKLTNALQSVRKKHRLSFVHAAIPESQAYIFQTTVPAANTNSSELRSLLEFQLKEHVPIAARDAVFDFTFLPERGQYRDELPVSVTVAARDVVGGYHAALSRAGLRSRSIETAAHSAARSLIPFDAPAETLVLVNIEPSQTQVNIVHGGQVYFTATLDVGGQSLYSGDRVQQDALETFSAQLKRHITYWDQRATASARFQQIGRVLLYGAGAPPTAVQEQIAGALALPVQAANVWENALSFADTIPPIHARDSYGYASAVGLALRDRAPRRTV